MKRKLSLYSMIISSIIIVVGCSNVESLSSPHLICAGKNPDGIGFDFVINNKIGAVYNLKEKPDLNWDLKIKVYRGYKENPPRKGLIGRPFIDLKGKDVKAYEYKGEKNYDEITIADVNNGSFKPDPADVLDLSTVKRYKGKRGSQYIYSGHDTSGSETLKGAYNAQMVIGDRTWIEGNFKAAVFIIKTREGRHVKFHVKGFPAGGKKGYVAVDWALLD